MINKTHIVVDTKHPMGLADVIEMFSSIKHPHKRDLITVHFCTNEGHWHEVEKVIGKPQYQYALKVDNPADILEALQTLNTAIQDNFPDNIDATLKLNKAKQLLHDLLHIITKEEEE